LAPPTKESIYPRGDSGAVVEMNDDARFIVEKARKHTEWFRECLPMIASENLISPLAMQMLTTDLHNRYAEGLPGARYYNGNLYVDEIELKVTEMAQQMFKCKWADVRPISGTVANIGVLKALGKPGTEITCTALSDGAHISTAKFGAVGVRGMKAVNYPFDTDVMNIDVDGARKVILETKPRIALFGRSVFLFPAPIKELQDALQEVGCYVWYDGAHVLGLIAGGKFQDPLREGAELITGSTHKTLPGPQHGIVLCNPRDDKMLKKVRSGQFPGVLSNHHLNAVAALGIAFAENMEFGAEYADQIIRNAQALGQAMYERGFKVLCPDQGFTASHTIAVDVVDHEGGAKVSDDLEKANVIANKNLLPWDTSPVHPSGIRLGTQELTRIGMKEDHMSEVADLLKKVAIDKKPPTQVREEVKALKAQFTEIHYCFDDIGTEAYKWYGLS